MMRCRNLACVAFLVLLSACSTVKKDIDQPDRCTNTSTSGDEETDGGLGGTGKQPGNCGDEEGQS